MITKEIKVWIGAAKGIIPPVKVSQYDTLWRFVFTVYKDDEVWQPEGAASVVMTGVKEDGTAFVYQGEVSGVNVLVDCGQQMTSAPGRVECELRFADASNEIICTVNFRLLVEKAPLTGYVASKTEIDALEQMTNATLRAAASVGNVAAVREEVAALRAAVGSPLTASTASGMSDHDKVYVYTGTTTETLTNGHWYYWGGSAWTDGGVYQSQGLDTDTELAVAGAAADAKAVGDAHKEMNAQIKAIDQSLFSVPYTPSNMTVVAGDKIYLESGYISAADGSFGSSATGSYIRTQVGQGGAGNLLFIGRQALLITLGFDWLEWNCWSYSGTAATSATHSNTGNAYTRTTNAIYIPAGGTDARFGISFRKYVAPGTERTAITTAERTQIREALKMWVVTDTALRAVGSPADAAEVGELVAALQAASTESIDTSNILAGFGGLKNDGSHGTQTTRIRIALGNSSALYVRAGSTISVASGFKFNCAQYSRYETANDFDLIGIRGLSSDSFTVPQDCWIKVSVGTVNDDTLWEAGEDDSKQLTVAGMAAKDSVTLNLIGPSSIEKISQLSERVSRLDKDAIVPLRHEMPINALGYHALWDEMVSEGFCGRSAPIYMTNDAQQHWPLYTYTIKAHKDWMDPLYRVIPYDGTNEIYPRPKILIVSGVHGSERATPNFLLDFVKNTMRGDSEYAQLLVKYDWTIVPLANPWGYSHSFIKVSDGSVYYGQDDLTGNSDYVVRENLEENGYAAGIRRVASGHDMNRDFTDADYQYNVAYPSETDTRTYGFRTEEARYLMSVLQAGPYDLVIDFHQSKSNNSCGFVSFAGRLFEADNAAFYKMVVEAAAASDVAMCAEYDLPFGMQTAHPWQSISNATFKNYAAGKKTENQYVDGGYIGNINHPEIVAPCASVLETSTVCTAYSNKRNTDMTAWHNKYALDFGNTFFRNFTRRFLSEYSAPTD